MREKPDNWNELSIEEKITMRLDAWMDTDGIEFESAEAEDKYIERITLFRDAIELKKRPARVPVSTLAGGYALRRAGVPQSATMYDRWEEAADVIIKFQKEFDPDAESFAFFMSGKSMELLGLTNMKWPGCGLPDDSNYQALEQEYMTVDEYDHFLEDPSDFALRVYLPRLNSALKGLRRLPKFSVQAFGFVSVAGAFLDPEVQEALGLLKKAGELSMEPFRVMMDLFNRMRAMGYPSLTGMLGVGGAAPYDVLGDSIRGTKGIMIDLRRNPDKIIAACEKILSLMPDPDLPLGGSPLVMIPLHKGDDNFMSDEQYETFYWPTFKESLMKLINEGLIPVPFAEGSFNRRLKYIKELPRASSIWFFDQTDMHKAKDVLGDHCCLMGNVPISLIATGDAAQVKECCKDLIDYCGRDGGFIMSPGCQIDYATDESIRALIDFTKEYSSKL
jgi:hypothetical protein